MNLYYAAITAVSSRFTTAVQPFGAHCCHMGADIKHPVPDRIKPSFVIFDIRALWCSGGTDRTY